MSSRGSRSFRARRKITINVVGKNKRKITRKWYTSNSFQSQVDEVNANNIKDDGVALTCEDTQESTDVEQSLKKRKQVPYFDIAKKQAENWNILKKQALTFKLYNSSISLLTSRYSNHINKDNHCSNPDSLPNIPCRICTKIKPLDELIQCPDCLYIWYCHKCWENSHLKLSLFHKARIWCSKVGYYKTYKGDRQIIKSSSCQCVNTLSKEVIVFDSSGRQHESYVGECLCSPSVIDILLENNFWPSSPVHPTAAFSYELMDLMEALFLDGNVAVKSFCKALFTKSKGDNYIKVDTVYKLLTGECFLSYLLFKNDFRTFKPRFQNFTELSVCPACPKEFGTLVLSFDALFGLVRKFSSGKSHYEPVLKNFYLMDQSIVDEFVASYNSKLSLQELKACNDFKAINSLRSKKANAKLDETGVFGCACRHEIPRKFFNLKFGESLANAVFLINQVLQEVNEEVKVVVMYDIACVLVKHLKKRGSTILNKNLSFCIPSFHVYGHKSACQLQYSPKSTVGIGISDGEVMERLWSTLRRFSKITKEQTPSHRADTISLGLLHYAQYSINALGRRLCARYDKAVKIKDTTDIELEQTLKSINVSDRDVIQSWIATEIDMEEHRIQKNEKASDIESYALILDDWWKLRNDIAFTDRNSESFMELERLEKELNNKEKKLKINMRWDPTAHPFKDTITAVYERKRTNILQRVQSFAFQKLLLSNLKKRYADGQKKAIKVTKQLNKNNKRLQDAIKEFNSVSSVYPSNILPSTIVWDEVNNLESTFWKNLKDEPETLISITVKRKCVELYQLNCRAVEEIGMLNNEMQNVLNFYKTTIDKYKEGLASLEQSFLDDGWRAILLKEIDTLVGKKHWLSELFFQYFNSNSISETNVQFLGELEADLSTDSDESDIDFSIDSENF